MTTEQRTSSAASFEHVESSEWIRHHNDLSEVFQHLSAAISSTVEHPVTIRTESGAAQLTARWRMEKEVKENESYLWLRVVIEPVPTLSTYNQQPTRLEIRATLGTPVQLGSWYNNERQGHTPILKNMRTVFFGIECAWSQWLANSLKTMVRHEVLPASTKIEEMMRQTTYVDDTYMGDTMYSKYYKPEK